MKESQEIFAKHINPRRIKISRLYHKIEPNFPFIKIFKKLYYMTFIKDGIQGSKISKCPPKLN